MNTRTYNRDAKRQQMTPQLTSRMRTPINSVRFWPPLPFVQGEKITVRGSETARALKLQTLTLLSPLGRETRTKACHTASARLYSMTSARNLGACGSPLPLLKRERMACHAVALRRREVRGFAKRRKLNRRPSPCPLPREGRGDEHANV
jgi:hypothetical protein